MKTKSYLSTLGAVLLTATVAGAQQLPSNAETIARLAQALERCEHGVAALKGGPKGSMLLHQRLMDNVLEQLKAGQSVDPRNIEKAFANHTG